MLLSAGDLDFLLVAQIATALAGCGLASFLDLRNSRIPNKLSFSMLWMGVVFALARAEVDYLILWGLNFSSAFFIAYAVWSFKGWGGGDAKLFWATISVLPLLPYGSLISKFTFIPGIFLWLACLILFRFFLKSLKQTFKENNLQNFLLFLFRPSFVMALGFFALGFISGSLLLPVLLLSLYTTTKSTVTPEPIRLAPYLFCALALFLVFDLTSLDVM
ncbi:MAG: prepilin peptidase [Candidatus Altiarchaeota archaeon]|nr:prepilin peptidase [Candidatus Altiarchaeota archaeon]